MPTRKQELEAQIEALEAEVGTLEQERDEYRDALIQADDEVEQIRYRTSPEYQSELEAKLLAMDHHDKFRELAKQTGVLPRAVEHAWQVLQQDKAYQINGAPDGNAIMRALSGLRESHGFMFTTPPATSAPPAPQRWLPSGPPINFNTNGSPR